MTITIRILIVYCMVRQRLLMRLQMILLNILFHLKKLYGPLQLRGPLVPEKVYLSDAF